MKCSEVSVHSFASTKLTTWLTVHAQHSYGQSPRTPQINEQKTIYLSHCISDKLKYIKQIRPAAMRSAQTRDYAETAERL